MALNADELTLQKFVILNAEPFLVIICVHYIHRFQKMFLFSLHSKTVRIIMQISIGYVDKWHVFNKFHLFTIAEIFIFM